MEFNSLLQSGDMFCLLSAFEMGPPTLVNLYDVKRKKERKKERKKQKKPE